MNEDRPWLGDEPPPADGTLSAGPAGLGIFTAVAVPFAVYGATRPDGVDGLLIVFGVLLGAFLGVLVATILQREGGHPPGRGPRL